MDEKNDLLPAWRRPREIFDVVESIGMSALLGTILLKWFMDAKPDERIFKQFEGHETLVA